MSLVWITWKYQNFALAVHFYLRVHFFTQIITMRNSITNTIAITLGKLHNTKLLVFRTRSSCFSSRLAAEMFWGSETRVIIKISTHSWYLRTFDWFSWKWSKKKSIWLTQKTEFFKIDVALPIWPWGRPT